MISIISLYMENFIIFHIMLWIIAMFFIKSKDSVFFTVWYTFFYILLLFISIHKKWYHLKHQTLMCVWDSMYQKFMIYSFNHSLSDLRYISNFVHVKIMSKIIKSLINVCGITMNVDLNLSKLQHDYSRETVKCLWKLTKLSEVQGNSWRREIDSVNQDKHCC